METERLLVTRARAARSVTVKIKLKDNLSQSVFHRTRDSDEGLGAQRQIQSLSANAQ